MVNYLTHTVQGTHQASLFLTSGKNRITAFPLKAWYETPVRTVLPTVPSAGSIDVMVMRIMIYPHLDAEPWLLLTLKSS